MSNIIDMTDHGELSDRAINCLEHLLSNGPTRQDGDFDGDGRAELFRRGYAERFEGWTYLTTAGTRAALAIGSGDTEYTARLANTRYDHYRALYAAIEDRGGRLTVPADRFPADGFGIAHVRKSDGSAVLTIESLEEAVSA